MSPEYSIEQYTGALRKMAVKEDHRYIRMAKIHYGYPARDITATQAKEMGMLVTLQLIRSTGVSRDNWEKLWQSRNGPNTE